MPNKVTVLNEKEARALTGRIQRTWRNLEELLNQAIIHNVWTPLGYDSFTAWYDAEMSGIPLARGGRNLIVITMFAEQTHTKVTQADIAEMIGVSTATIQQIRKSWNAGLLPFLPPLNLKPAEDERVTPKRRIWTRTLRWMGVRVKIELHDELQDWGRTHGKTLREIQEESLELYADLNVRKGVEPSPQERRPNTSARRATTRARLSEKPKFQEPES